MYRLNTYTPPTRIDREKRIIYGVSLIQANIEAIGHRMMTDQTTIHLTAQLGQAKPNGLKSRFTHPGLSNDGMGKFLGRLHNHRVEGGKAVADLHLSVLAANSPNGDLATYTMDLAEKEPDMFGMSIVFTGNRVWKLPNGEELDASKHERPSNAINKLPLVRPTELRAADLVDEPAANRDGLFAAAFSKAFSHTTSELAEQAFTSLDYYTQQHNLTPASLPALLDAYYAHNFNAIPQDIQQYIDLMLAQTNYEPSQVYSFIHRYVLARQVRPFSSNTQPKEVNPMEQVGKSSTPVEPTAVAETQTTQPATPDTAAFMAKFTQELLTMRLKNQGNDLPQAMFAQMLSRIQNGRISTEAEFDEELATNRTTLAALAEDEAINLPRRPINSSDMLTAEDRASDMVDWFFGVEGAPVPPYNYRRFDQLYVALSGDTSFTGVFDPTFTQFSGASPVTLPNMALDALQKVVRGQFARLRYYRWYELVTNVEANDGSLHDPKWIVYGGSGDLPIVEDGEAYSEGSITDGKEVSQFEKRGRFIGITRKMIKNSDIAKIRAIPIALATDAVRTRSAKIAALFTQNAGVGPTLTDGDPLFKASYNVAATALGTDTTAWEAASAECFSHTEIGTGKPIATFAKYCLTPGNTLYFQALKNFGYGDGNPTTYNPFAVPDRTPEDPRPVVLAVPDWTDATDWAYLADPNIWPVLLMTYSQNPGGKTHPQPEIFSVTSETAGLMFTNDQMPIKVRDEFAAGVNGRSGIGKRNVP